MFANTFYRLAGKQIKALVQPHGFKKSGRFFYRITEEGIVQQFCLLWLQGFFTVRFYLSSIYSDNEKGNEGEEIYMLINGSFNEWLSDAYSDSIQPTISFVTTAAEVCTQAVQNTLLPFFESHKDPFSARAAIIRHNACIAQGAKKYDLRELGLFLSLGDTASARDYLKYHIDNCDRFNHLWWQDVEQEYRQLLAAICAGDQEYLSSYMNDKKSKTYAMYKWTGRK